MYAVLYYTSSNDSETETLFAGRSDTVMPRILWFETLQDVRLFYDKIRLGADSAEDLAQFLSMFRPHVLQWESMAGPLGLKWGKSPAPRSRARLVQYTDDGAVYICPMDLPPPSADGKEYCGIYMAYDVAMLARERAVPLCSAIHVKV